MKPAPPVTTILTGLMLPCVSPLSIALPGGGEEDNRAWSDAGPNQGTGAPVAAVAASFDAPCCGDVSKALGHPGVAHACGEGDRPFPSRRCKRSTQWGRSWNMANAWRPGALLWRLVSCPCCPARR